MIAAVARLRQGCDPGTKDSDEIGLRQQLLKLQTDRVRALAFRAGVSAHQKSDRNSVGVRTRWKAGINLRSREMPCIDSLAAQQSHKKLGRKVIGW